MRPDILGYARVSTNEQDLAGQILRLKTAIQASESEAPYVLDDLVHNESAVEILEHATDTAGATETIFAMFPQYGYRLTPRMRNLGDRKLFVIGPSADYAPLAPLIGGTANLSVVEENWDELLRLWASIGSGLAPPSVILRKIAAAPECARQGAEGNRAHRTLDLHLRMARPYQDEVSMSEGAESSHSTDTRSPVA